jgi:hypothetical protein
MEFWVSRFCAIGDAGDCGRFDVSRRAIGATDVFDRSLMNRPADSHRALFRTSRPPSRRGGGEGRLKAARSCWRVGSSRVCCYTPAIPTPAPQRIGRKRPSIRISSHASLPPFTIHTRKWCATATLDKVALLCARRSLDLNRWYHEETDAQRST